MKVRYSLIFLGASVIIHIYGALYSGWTLNYEMGFLWNLINTLFNPYFLSGMILGIPSLYWNLSKYSDYGLISYG